MNKYLKLFIFLAIPLVVNFIFLFLVDINYTEAEIGAGCNTSNRWARNECEGEGEKCLGMNTICVPEETTGYCESSAWSGQDQCPSGFTCRDIPREVGSGTLHLCMPEDSDEGEEIVSDNNTDASAAWRQEQLARAESSERGIFTEGLSAECIAFGKCSRCDILIIAGNIFRFVFQIVGILAVLVIFIGGLTYVRSGGNEEATGRAKKIITAAVVGLIIVFSAWLIINTIVNLTGLNVGGSWWSPSC